MQTTAINTSDADPECEPEIMISTDIQVDNPAVVFPGSLYLMILKKWTVKETVMSLQSDTCKYH